MFDKKFFSFLGRLFKGLIAYSEDKFGISSG